MDPKTSLDTVLDTKRYEVGEPVGRGTWGVVYAGKDTFTDEDVAIKVLDPTEIAMEQMAERNIDSEKAMKKEGGGLEACSNIVPRKFEKDDNGTPFIVMPLYDKFLSDVLEDSLPINQRTYVGKGLSCDTAKDYLIDISKGIEEMHTKLNRVHGDIKPDNIAMKREGIKDISLLNDLGTSTCASVGQSVSPRDNMGDIYSRAYESFKEGSHPTESSDVFSLGSLAYRFFTGEYLFESELENTKNPKLFFEQLGSEGVDALVNKKLRKVPKGFRKFIKKCVAYNPHERFMDGSSARKGLEKMITGLNSLGAIKNTFRRWALPVAIASGLLSLGIHSAVTYEPRVSVPVSTGPYFAFSSLDNKSPAIFERENLENLPRVPSNARGIGKSTLRLYTQNMNVAELLQSYSNAVQHYGTVNMDFITDNQMKMWASYTNSAEKQYTLDHLGRVAKCIEVAMTNSVNSKGNVDLEDNCVKARLGFEKFHEARFAAGSEDFQDYIIAKDKTGKYIIPEKEQKFLKTWLAYINETI